jgi:hypothetical protein
MAILHLLALAARWALVPIACYVGFHLAIVPGLVTHERIRYWCPWGDPELVAAIRAGESVECPVPGWFDHVTYFATAGLAAVAVVMFGALAAPVKRPWLPWAVCCTGCVVASWMTIRLPSHALHALFACAAGAVAAAATSRRIQRRMTG